MANIVQIGYEVDTKQLKKAADFIEQLETKARKAQRQLGSIGDVKLSGLAKDSKQAANSLNVVAISSLKVDKNLNRLKGTATTSLGKVATQSRAANDHLRAAADSAESVKTKIGGINKEPIDRVTKSTGGLYKKFKSIKALLAGGLFAVIVGQSAGFADSLAEVSTLVDTTTFNMEKLSDEALNQGKIFGNLQAQPKAYYQIISAGAETAAEATETLTAANKLAVGGVTDITTAADGLTSVMNAYGDKVEGATAVSDAMFIAMKAGKTTIGELSGGLGKVAPLAAQAGVSFDELVSGVAALTKGGISTTESMTGLRAIMASVVKPTKEAQEMAQRLGIQFNSTGLETKGLAGFLEEIKTKTGGSTEAMAQLFSGVEALVPVLALTGEAGISFNDTLEQMKAKAGASQEAFDKMAKSPIFQGKRLLANAQAEFLKFGLVIANGLVPAMTMLADNMDLVTPLAGILATVMVARLIPAMLGVAARTLIATSGLISYAASLGASTLATGAMAIASRGLGVAMALAGGPIGLVVVALAGLAAWYLNSRSEAEKLKHTVLLSNGTHATHGDILNKVNGISSEYVMATKDRRVEIKGEVQDLILNSKALLENESALLASLKAKQFFYNNDPSTRRARTRGSGTVLKRVNLEFNNQLKAQQTIVDANQKSLSALQSRYDSLGKTIKPTATKIYGLNGAIGGTTKAAKQSLSIDEEIYKQHKLYEGTYKKRFAALVKERGAVKLSTAEQYKQELQLIRIGDAKEKLEDIDVIALVNYKKETAAIKKQIDKIAANKKAHDDFYITQVKLDRERKLGFTLINGLTEAESRNHSVKLKQIALDNKYISVREELNRKIGFQNVLNNQRADAARLYTLEIEHGTKERALHVLQQEKNLEALQDEAIAWGHVGDSMYDAITKGIDLMPSLEKGIRGVVDSLLDVVSGSGSFGDVLGSLGDIYKTGGGVKGGIQNYQTGSQLAGAFDLNKGGQIGGGIGSMAGTAIGGPAGGAIGNIIGGMIGNMFGGFHDIVAQFGTITKGEGVYASDRNKTGKTFTREGVFGEYGLEAQGSLSIGRDDANQIPAMMAMLDIVEGLDDAAANLLTKGGIANATKNLESFSTNALDGDQFIKDRFKIIVAEMGSEVRSLIDLGAPLAEIGQTIAGLSNAAQIGVPSLKFMNFELGNSTDKATAATYTFTKMAGGLANIVAANDNYVNKLFTGSEKIELATSKNKDAILAFQKETGAGSVKTAAQLKDYIESIKKGGGVLTKAGQENLLAAYNAVDAYAFIRDQNIQSIANEQSILQTQYDKTSEVITRLTQSTLAINSAWKDTSGVLGLVNAGSFAAKEGLVNFAGGLNELQGLVSGYFGSSLFTEAEQGQQKLASYASQLKSFNDSLGLTGQNEIDTRQELRDFIGSNNNATSLASSATQEAFIKALSLVEQVAGFEDAANGGSIDSVLNGISDELKVTFSETLSPQLEMQNQSNEKLDKIISLNEERNKRIEELELEQLALQQKNNDLLAELNNNVEYNGGLS